MSLFAAGGYVVLGMAAQTLLVILFALARRSRQWPED